MLNWMTVAPLNGQMGYEKKWDLKKKKMKIIFRLKGDWYWHHVQFLRAWVYLVQVENDDLVDDNL